jgi:RimJ/RimL family protein N-acetyltransferase
VSGRFAIELEDDGAHLRALEPTRAEVVAAASRLAGYYNEPYNRAMLSHAEDMSAHDVVAHYRGLAAEGGRPFLLEHEGALVGDGDLRRVERGRAEAAILVGERSVQGKGLGTRFGVMLHAFAFRALGLARVYASIIPANAASLRLFEKLGYERDDSRVARRYADERSDVTLSLAPARFDERHGALAARVRFVPRGRRT